MNGNRRLEFPEVRAGGCGVGRFSTCRRDAPGNWHVAYACTGRMKSDSLSISAVRRADMPATRPLLASGAPGSAFRLLYVHTYQSPTSTILATTSRPKHS